MIFCQIWYLKYLHLIWKYVNCIFDGSSRSKLNEQSSKQLSVQLSSVQLSFSLCLQLYSSFVQNSFRSSLSYNVLVVPAWYRENAIQCHYVDFVLKSFYLPWKAWIEEGDIRGWYIKSMESFGTFGILYLNGTSNFIPTPISRILWMGKFAGMLLLCVAFCKSDLYKRDKNMKYIISVNIVPVHRCVCTPPMRFSSPPVFLFTSNQWLVKTIADVIKPSSPYLHHRFLATTVRTKQILFKQDRTTFQKLIFIYKGLVCILWSRFL